MSVYIIWLRHTGYFKNRRKNISNILKYYKYELEFSNKTTHQAFAALTQALEEEPESVIAIAYLASMHAGSCMLDGLPKADMNL